ncbi:MAG TPA: PA2169 family four-helix-bundle protein [Brevundimonas sp.]|uniref:PA2169 family four-helix-bundle protein n=1 Tax=Brevundimonas sp. TaxID=1871086 RepID=UPI002615F58C|nr:PA2169 family four-helix-bundle protein [Brevundimonas sp.]HRO33720.1 PA2169 family four-helix-bundle protein [Brevundimonas sp.]
MTSPNAHDIKVLNGLIETTLDSADGYREAAAETENAAYRGLFEQRSFERRRVADDLQGTVRTLGGEPEDDGSILAKAHRAFLDIKHALLRDEQAVVNTVEQGEDFIKARFEKALEDSDVSATTRETIRRAYGTVREGHDQMRDLKHSREGRADADGRLYPN